MCEIGQERVSLSHLLRLHAVVPQAATPGVMFGLTVGGRGEEGV